MRCNNLPSQLSTFIGREREVAAATRLLHATRLLTLTGPGGCGKTRLALAVAEGLLRRYPEGVWFVDLASISDPDLVPQTVAMTLSFRPLPGRPVVESLAAQLGSKHVLLLLDNCEHLIAACADLAFTLLTSAPGLRILATSREPLHVTGETTWPVPPLAVPEPKSLPPLEQLARVAAVRLFVERAGRTTPGFTLTAQNAAPVSQVCHWLAGSPLAIELAAARTRVLSPAQIAARLENALSLLATDNRTVPTRHRTLRATLDWSYDLLSEGEQALFRRLAVFPSHFSIDAAQAIGGHDESVEPMLELLAGLVDKSLLEVDSEVGHDRRFRYLEPVRQYALAKLDRSREEPDARRRLLAWAVALAEEVGPGTFTESARESVDRLELEHANLRAALAGGLSEAGDTLAARRLANALTQFWQSRGYIGEGVHWLEHVISKPHEAPDRLRIDTLQKAGFLAIHARNFLRARQYLEQGIGLAQGLGDRHRLAELYHTLCFLTFSEGNLVEAERLGHQVLRMYEEQGDDWGRAIAYFYLANIDCLRQDYPKARMATEQSLTLCRQIGYVHAAARRQVRLGQILCAEGDFARGRACITEGLRTGQESGDAWVTAMSLAALAGLALHEGQHKQAAWLLGVTQYYRDTFGTPFWIFDEIEYDRNRAELVERLGERAFAEAGAAGAKEAAADLDAVLEKVLAKPAQNETREATAAPSRLPASDPATAFPLSRREQEVAALIAQGKSNAEIAASLFVGMRTVEAHVTHILNKLGFNSRSQIAAWAATQATFASPELPQHKRGSR